MTTSTEKAWCYSLDDETFNSGTFPTKEAAIISAVRDYDPAPGAIIHFARATKPDLSELFDVDDLIDGAMQRADELGGEYADGFPDIDAVEKQELEKLILSFLKPLVEIPFYTVSESNPHTITLDDLHMTAIQVDAELQAKRAAVPHEI